MGQLNDTLDLYLVAMSPGIYLDFSTLLYLYFFLWKSENYAKYISASESKFYLWLLAELAVGRRVVGRIHLLWRAVFLQSKNNVSH